MHLVYAVLVFLVGMMGASELAKLPSMALIVLFPNIVGLIFPFLLIIVVSSLASYACGFYALKLFPKADARRFFQIILLGAGIIVCTLLYIAYKMNFNVHILIVAYFAVRIYANVMAIWLGISKIQLLRGRSMLQPEYKPHSNIAIEDTP